MSVILNPEIISIDTSSALYAIYMKLYQAFFDAQEKKSEQAPFGIEEGDDNSMRLKNTAYTFALSMMEAAANGGGGEDVGGVIPDGAYIKKSGDSMFGELSASYGFKAGINNTEALRITQKSINNIIYGVLSVTGKLEVASDNLIIDGANVLSYRDGTLQLNGTTVNVNSSLTVGTAESGLIVSPTQFKHKGQSVYHQGNCNSTSVDWFMKKAYVGENLHIEGKTTVSGGASIVGEFSVNNQSTETIGVRSNIVSTNGLLDLSDGVRIKGKPVLSPEGVNIKIGSESGALVLGTTETTQLRINTSLTDSSGTHVLINKNGVASFHNGLSVKHNFGDVILQTYRVDSVDEGIIFPKKIKIGSQSGASISAFGNGVKLSSNVTSSLNIDSTFSVSESTSIYKPKNEISYALNIDSNAIGFVFKKPIEAINYIGIDGSSTRLTNNTLFFTDNSQLLSVSGGIKHYGNTYILGNIGSEIFASGFGGYGWNIAHNQTSGDHTATFDSILVRKKMQVYELNVQKISAINGSFWVSNSCSGDTVSKL